jgi:lactoylglutathione lyase
MESSHSNISREGAARDPEDPAETLTALQLPVKVYHRAVRVGLTVGCAARPTQWEGCAFWRDIMGLDMTYGDETMGYAYFDTGNSGVELLDRDAFATTLGAATPTPTPEGHQAVLVFGVDDVDATYCDLVARGATPLAEPQDRPAWRARTAPLRAYDGYLVEIYSPLGDANAPNA